MYLEIADKEYNGYKYQQVNKKDLIDTIEAICRFENLRWFVLDIYDTTNIISKLAYVCQLNGVYSFDFEDITPFTEMDKEYMPLLADLLKEHPYINRVIESDNRYTAKLSYEYVKDCDDGKLKRLSNEEVTEIINKHDEAIILGEDYFILRLLL